MKNSLMLFSPSPKFVEADCGPHLLPKFVEAGYWVHLLPKFVEADCGPHLIPKVCRSWLLATPVPRTHTFSQKLSKLVIGYTTPQSLPARPAPHQLPHPTPTIHPPYTIPQPRPYPSSCELTATK